MTSFELTRLNLAKLLVSLVNDINAEEGKIEIFGVSDGDVDIGDWVVLVKRVRDPA